MNQSNDIVLLDYEFSNGKKKLMMVLTFFKDVPKIDIREYYYDEPEKDYKHTKKGVQLDAQKSEALRAALEQNSIVIAQHLISENLENWLHQVRRIETKADFFSNYEFYKTISFGDTEEIIFNINHPIGKKIMQLSKEIEANKNETAAELLEILKVLLICFNQTNSQFEDNAKVIVSDYVQDQMQIWSSLLKRIRTFDK